MSTTNSLGMTLAMVQPSREVRYHVPPRCQGQIVEYSYALWADGCGGSVLVRRREDRSTGEVSYDVALPQDDEEGDFWNGEPTPAGEWEPVAQ